MTTLFVSDTHLDPARPEITGLFLEFLSGPARGAEALYVLGDLFEAWIGDDDHSEPGASVADGFASLADAGVPVFLMHGNRDFLIGPDYARRCRATLLDDPAVEVIGGEPTLLMHGDTLCIDDLEYQDWRARVRTDSWRREFLELPLEERRRLAKRMRAVSREHTSTAAEYIMDVNPVAVHDAMKEHGVRRLIHGHTHRPAIHSLELEGEPAERIVLGDWYEQGSVLECDESGCRLKALSLP